MTDSQAINDQETPSEGSTTRIVAVTPGNSIDLYVENPNGDIRIGSASRDDILVRWEKHGRPGSPWYDEAGVNVTQEDDNRISVKVSLPPFWPGGDFGRSVLKFLEGGLKGNNPFSGLGGGNVNFDLWIELPRQILESEPSKLRVRTANGDVNIDDVPAAVDVATANGEVGISGARGEISVHAANGDLSFDRPNGVITARTVSGDLKIRDGDLTRFTLTTVNGDVSIGTILTGDASRIESVNGDVRLDLTVPAATGASLSVRTVSGDTDVAPPFRSVAKRSWRLGPGTDGGPSIAIKSVSGDLHARGKLSDDVSRTVPSMIVPQPPAPPQPPPMPQPPRERQQPAAEAKVDTRLSLLQAVERGEIDIEEALRRLDGLG